MEQEIPDIQRLANRLEEVEDYTRRLKWTVIALAIVFLVLVFIIKPSPSLPGELEAEAFYLRDEAGRVRAMLSSLVDTVAIMILDMDEKIRADIYIDNNNNLLRFWDSTGRLRTGIGIDSISSSFVLMDENARTRVSLNVSESWTGLAFFDTTGNNQMELGVSDGHSKFNLVEVDGKRVSVRELLRMVPKNKDDVYQIDIKLRTLTREFETFKNNTNRRLFSLE